MVAAKKTIPFTPQKYQEIKDKVVELERRREETMKRLKIAREMGDLSENGAYKYAKFELRDIGRQLRSLKKQLLYGYPAQRKISNGTKKTVVFGCYVTVEKQDESRRQSTYTIVSKHESDLFAGKLAYSSPMGAALMNKTIGDLVEVQTPKGVTIYKVLSVD